MRCAASRAATGWPRPSKPARTTRRSAVDLRVGGAFLFVGGVRQPSALAGSKRQPRAGRGRFGSRREGRTPNSLGKPLLQRATRGWLTMIGILNNEEEARVLPQTFLAARHNMTDAGARPTLSIRTAAPRPSEDVVSEAIGRRTCVTATYNRTTIRLAPHVLYTRHDELFVDGATMERDGQRPREVKIGTFKLVGLAGVAATRVPFETFSGFDPADVKYEGVTLASVAMEAASSD